MNNDTIIAFAKSGFVLRGTRVARGETVELAVEDFELLESKGCVIKAENDGEIEMPIQKEIQKPEEVTTDIPKTPVDREMKPGRKPRKRKK